MLFSSLRSQTISAAATKWDFSSHRTSKHFLTKCSQIAIIKLYSDHVERDTHSYNRVHMHTWYTAARTRCTHNWKVREENNPSHGDVPMNNSNKLCHEVPHTEHAFICILVASIINIAIFLKIQMDSLPQKVARSFPLARGWAETESFISTAFYPVKWLRARVLTLHNVILKNCTWTPYSSVLNHNQGAEKTFWYSLCHCTTSKLQFCPL